ncbi:AP-1 complex subunit gamma SCDLUD_000129 [Saccharomycodes ludwigii]|uniref:AP-1 complex subunit gamma n=1 Tax=Saccharomycodes ludwigii TaxID=36035 RepID=UPI001E84E448|nr:hypothetical protein SCDLUD_000129 [Saccharomycodes ludwigii]KAH3902550.1 hypothetical protein SCDLUD_000129 [Saccharomycodes ludwigii]
MGSLKQFIKDVRNANTLAKERSIITKESAKIRTQLRNDQLEISKRRSNIQKLLYLYILGEKTHFGQVECINLIASDNFINKRLGYLAAMLLLKNENPDLLTLITNLINYDLQHSNKYIVALALTTMGDLCNAELAIDLYPDVLNILNKRLDEPYLIKHSLFVASEIILKAPQLIIQFTNDGLIGKIIKNYRNRSLRTLSNCTHGVLLAVLQFMKICLLQQKQQKQEPGKEFSEEEIQDFDETIKRNFTPLIPELMEILKTCHTNSFEPEYDVNGVSDPFLQVALLQTLTLLFSSNLDVDVLKNDLQYLLTNIATTNETNNRGFSVQYETVKTIFILDLDPSLRVLGVNILGKFLNSKDSNNKYVALNTLLKVVPIEPETVTRHKKFIVRCLYELDPSIKRRSLELIFAIFNKSNAGELISELIKFLSQSTESDKGLMLYIVDNLLDLYFDSVNNTHTTFLSEADQFIMIVALLKYCGKFIYFDRLSDILLIVNNFKQTETKKKLTVELLSKLINKGKDNKKEDDDYYYYYYDNNYGWKLISCWCCGEYGDLIHNEFLDDQLVSFLTSLNQEFYSQSNMHMINYILTSCLKLSIKIADKQNIEKLRQLIKSHSMDANLILQMKANQFLVLFNEPAHVKRGILDVMPAFSKNVATVGVKNNGNGLSYNEDSVSKGNHKTFNNKNQQTDLLLDLLDDIPANDTTGALANNASASTADMNSISLPTSSIELYTSKDYCLKIYGNITSIADNEANLDIYIQNTATNNRKGTNLKIFIAVSKHQKVTLGHLSDTIIPSNNGGMVKQKVRITGEGKLKLRVRLQFLDETNNEKTIQFDYKFDEKL